MFFSATALVGAFNITRQLAVFGDYCVRQHLRIHSVYAWARCCSGYWTAVHMAHGRCSRQQGSAPASRHHRKGFQGHCAKQAFRHGKSGSPSWPFLPLLLRCLRSKASKTVAISLALDEKTFNEDTKPNPLGLLHQYPSVLGISTSPRFGAIAVVLVLNCT